MKSILLIGFYHSQNSGVMAMVESIVQQFPNESIKILTSDAYLDTDKKRYSQYPNVSFYKVEWFDKSLINYLKLIMGLFGVCLYDNFNKIIKDTDLVIDVSGDSISSDYGTKSMFFSLFPAYLISRKVPLLYGPQTMGPFKTITQQYLAKKAFKISKRIFLREDISKEFLQNIKVDVKNSHADLAFLLRPKTNSIKLPENTIGIGLSVLIEKFGEINSQRMFRSIVDICLSEGYNVLLITHVDTKNGSDVKFGETLKKNYYASSEKVIFLNKNFIASEWKYIIGQCKGVISARMHPIVQAVSQSIPSLNISYNHKSYGVIQKRFYPYAKVIDMKDPMLEGEIKLFLKNINRLRNDPLFEDKVSHNINLAYEFINISKELL